MAKRMWNRVKASGATASLIPAIGLLAFATAGCGSGDGSSIVADGGAVMTAIDPSTLPADTYVLDLRRFDDGGPATFINESLAFRVDLSRRVEVPTVESADFRKLYNRLVCGGGDDLAQSFFGDLAEFAAAPPARLETVTIEWPRQPQNDERYGPQTCLAWRTTDGVWHGAFAPRTASYDAAANVFRLTLDVHADHVDNVGVVIADGSVNTVTYVAKAE